MLAPLPLDEPEVQLSISQLPAAQRGSVATAVPVVFQQAPPSVPPCLPASNTAQVVVTYRAADGQPGVARLSLQLPMSLFCQVGLGRVSEAAWLMN